MYSTAKKAAPVGSRPAQQVRRPEAFILSSDDALVLEMGPAFGDRFRSKPIDKLDELNANVSSESRWLAVIDTASRPDGRALVARIEQSYPQAPLIVIVADGQESHWQQALNRGNVCRVLARSQVGTPALADALLLAEQRLQSASAAGGSTAEPRKSLPWLPFASGAVVVVAGVLWLTLRGPDSTTAAKAVVTTAPQPAVTGSLAPTRPVAVDQRSAFELLSAARVAFRDQDLLLPRSDAPARGDSALELYALALSREPQNDEALDGLRRLQSVARSRMQSDLSAGRIEEAQRLVAIFKASGFDPEAVKAMETDIAAARPKALLAQARRAIASGDTATANALLTQMAAGGADRNALQELRNALDARQQDTQLNDLASGLRAAIAAGNLLEPTAGNARTQWLAMRQQGRSHPLVLTTQRELQLALVNKGREALKAQQMDVAQRYASAAAELGAGTELADLRRQIQAETDQAASQQAAAVNAAAATAAAAAATPASAPAAPDYVTARAAKPLTVDYPEQAARSRLTGYVVVEFVLNPDGSASSVKVLESQPQKIFDRSAVDAVSHGRFDTTALGAGKQPRIARIRLSFKPS